jgi:hypothetical protein
LKTTPQLAQRTKRSAPSNSTYGDWSSLSHTGQVFHSNQVVIARSCRDAYRRVPSSAGEYDRAPPVHRP